MTQLSSTYLNQWLCVGPEGAQSLTFHFLRVEIGYNRRHCGVHHTAILLSVETFVVFEVVVDRQSSNKLKICSGEKLVLRSKVLSNMSHFQGVASASDVGMHVKSELIIYSHR